MLRFRTVRAKLTALVAMSGLVLLAALPLLFLAMHEQLVGEADDRVEVAEEAFAAELEDGMHDLRLAAELIATDSDTQRAIEARDRQALHAITAAFRREYPEMDLLFAAPGGEVLAHPGCESAPGQLARIEALAPAVRGERVEGVTRHGCESAEAAPPSYIVAVPVTGGGVVVVCLPLGRTFLSRAATKSRLELAITARGGDAILESSAGFPVLTVPGVAAPPHLETGVEGRDWVSVRRDAGALEGPVQSYALVAALDVTQLTAVVERQLVVFASVLLIAAFLALVAGWRMASVMSNALQRVSRALKRLEQQEYVHVEALRTGDELEDLALGFNTMVDGLKERDKLRTTMGKYMTASVMDHLLDGKVELGGVSIEVTILFTDIRGFTSISERMDAQALVGLLNEYFSEMVSIVMNEEGVVDKYIGDAIMAVFGAPVPTQQDPVNAVRAAVRMRQALVHLNERLAQRGIEPLRTGIGLHTGEVVAGNIGSERRMEYTVIGDAVNVASRLESSTKELGMNVLISEETYERTKHAIRARPIGEITVKGRAQPVQTYEVLGLRDDERDAPKPSERESQPIVHASPE